MTIKTKRGTFLTLIHEKTSAKKPALPPISAETESEISIEADESNNSENPTPITIDINSKSRITPKTITAERNG